MSSSTRFSPEVRERAVRLLLDSEAEHGSRWAAIKSIAQKVGCSAQTLNTWVQQHERDHGARAGLSTDEKGRMKELEKENRELRRANESLRKASAFFGEAELDRKGK